MGETALAQRSLAEVARGVLAVRDQRGDSDQANAWLVKGRRGPLEGATYAGWRIGCLASDVDVAACGGQGTIYRCRNLQDDQPGLLEVLTGRDAADPEVVRELLAKAREALPLVSPAVLRVLHAGTWAGVPFTLREYDNATDLGTVLQRLHEAGERLTLAQALDLAAQIAHALADAEAVGLAHGDLHPRWVRVSPYGVVRIAGFGRAMPLGPDGTYRAPEVTDRPGDQRSDQYALGCLLYELCCGQPPFTAKTSVVLRRRHRFREPTWAARLNPQLGPEHLAVMLACLQKRPEDRYAKMADLARDLDALQAGTLTDAVQRGLKSTGGWAAYRAYLTALSARLAPLAAMLLVLISAGMAGFQWLTGDEKPPAMPPTVEPPQVTPDSASVSPAEKTTPSGPGKAMPAETTREESKSEVTPKNTAAEIAPTTVAQAKQDLAALATQVVVGPAALAQGLASLALLHQQEPTAASLPLAAERLAVLAGPNKPAWASSVGRDEAGAFAVVEVPGAQPLKLHWVPPGGVQLGSPPDEPGRRADERQTPVLVVAGCWFAETECTQALWRAITATNPSHVRGDDLPVDSVSWSDCQNFLARLATSVGKGFAPRLPSEVEWEYACRAGVSGPYSATTPSDRATARVAWFRDNAGGISHVVKGLVANPLGLFDMHGNVAEWCQDVYVPAGPGQAGKGDERVARGGSWVEPAAGVRAATRIHVKPGTRTRYIGLRIVADPGWPDGGPPDLLKKPQEK